MHKTPFFWLFLFLPLVLSAQNQVFWDFPQFFSRANAHFPQVATGNNQLWAAWQEALPSESGLQRVSISLASKRSGEDWQRSPRVLVVNQETNEDTVLYSLAVDNQGFPWLAVLNAQGGIDLYQLDSQGQNPRLSQSWELEGDLLSPQLSFPEGRDPILLATLASVNNLGFDFFGVVNVRQRSGIWDPEFTLLSGGVDQEEGDGAELAGQTLAFRPTYAQSSLGEHIAYQVFVPVQNEEGQDRGNSNQIFLINNLDSGTGWSQPQIITDFTDIGAIRQPLEYDNQRPSLITMPDGTLGMSWERNIQGLNPGVYFSSFDPRNPELSPNRVNTSPVRSGDAVPFLYKNEVHILWYSFEGSRNRIYLGQRQGSDFLPWLQEELSGRRGAPQGQNLFPAAGVIAGDSEELYVFWENAQGEDRNVILLGPDQDVQPPVLRPLGFQESGKTRRESLTASIDFPADSSGLAGYSFLLTQSLERDPQELVIAGINNRSIPLNFPEDGLWYLKVILQDRAGNWSEPAVITVNRDRQPPAKPRILALEYDDFGFPLSNSFTLSWQSRDDETVGYQHRLRLVSTDSQPWNWANVQEDSLPFNSLGPATSRSFSNIDNGKWAFSLASIDEVGNQSEPTTYYFSLNKYRSVTIISRVTSSTDEFGTVTLRIQGRGFTAQGLISEVILDEDGQAPYDAIFSQTLGDFQILSDTLISGPTIQELDEGTYRVGVRHPVRGRVFTGPIIRIDEFGTIRLGDFRVLNKPFWEYLPIRENLWTVNGILYWSIMLLFLLGTAFGTVKALGYAVEGAQIKQEVHRILEGPSLSAMQKRKAKDMAKKGLGLRIKFAISILAITTMVILMVSITLGVIFNNNSRENLGASLEEKTELLLDSMVTNAVLPLREPAQETLALNDILNLTEAMEESNFAVITGNDELGQTSNFNYGWVENNPQILENINTAVFQPGISEYIDPLSEQVQALQESINNEAPGLIADALAAREEFLAEVRRLSGRNDAESRRQLDELLLQERAINQAVEDALAPIRDQLLTYPEFIPQNLSSDVTEYIFFKPVVDVDESGQNNFYTGGIRIAISVERILERINAEQLLLIQITGVIALIALGLGLAGALILSAITVNPIKKLVAGVEIIRDTEDKSQLKSHTIEVNTGDELADLATTINDMTKGLVKASEANKELIVGKEVQKMFIPLFTDNGGRKMTTGKETSDYADFFGYYEGAKGVSGDYFDFSRIDEDHFAVIKCDVAGKGVPAALIMVEVATIFLNHFKDWPQHKSMDLTPLTYRMNDLLEERGFKGRFAALVMLIFNEKTGKCHIINAGDKLLHLFKASQKRMVTIELPESPAAGVFASFLVEMQNPFKQVELTLEKGDTLWLFTDGIEESQNTFRDENHNAIFVKEPGRIETLTTEAEDGIGVEELGLERIDAILNAVYNKGTYVLKKIHPAIPGEELVFDFSKLQGSVSEAVIALVAVEQMFRLHPPGGSQPTDKLQVDTSIVNFLQATFKDFTTYFPTEGKPGELQEYLNYDGLSEDGQYDDLTVLAIQKK
jgi:hypothetical protein